MLIWHLAWIRTYLKLDWFKRRFSINLLYPSFFDTTMSRAFCIPGIVFLVAALVLSFLVSVSLPFLPALDIVRTNFQGGVQQGAIGTVQTRVSFNLPPLHTITHKLL